MLGRILSLLRSGLIDDTKTSQAGDTDTLGNVIMEKTVTGYTRLLGKTKPTDTLAGYAPGCIFQHIDGGSATAAYVNEGTVLSCDFNAIPSDASQVTLTGTQTISGNKTYSGTSAFSGVATFTADPVFNNAGTAGGRGPSPLIWADAPILPYTLDPTDGMSYFCDFNGNMALAANQAATLLDQGIMGFTAATAGSTISQIATDPNGVLHLETTTDNETISISALGGKNAAAQYVITAGKKSWFEARIKVLNITDAKFGLFCGFAEEGLLTEGGLIADAGTLTDKDLFGFFKVEADGDKLDTVCNTEGGGGITTIAGDAVTLEADTFIKIGYRCDGTTVTFYANGAALGTTVLVADTNVPDGQEMAFYFVLNAGHADTCSCDIDWVRIAREF